MQAKTRSRVIVALSCLARASRVLLRDFRQHNASAYHTFMNDGSTTVGPFARSPQIPARAHGGEEPAPTQSIQTSVRGMIRLRNWAQQQEEDTDVQQIEVFRFGDAHCCLHCSTC